MKKNILNGLENINETRKLSKEVEKKIIDRTVANGAICISIMILIMTFVIVSNFLPTVKATFVYNAYAIEFLIVALVLLEIAYKKDSGKWAITGIEILVLAVFTLFAPYIFIRFNNKFIYASIALISLYYVLKIVKIYCSEKKEYLSEISDITDIVKKESKDELVKEEQERKEEEKKMLLEQEKQEEQNKKKKTVQRTKKTKKNDKDNKQVKAETKTNKKAKTTSQKSKKTTTTKKKTIKEGE